MDGNVGMVDRWIRGLLGIGLLALWWFAVVQGTLAVVLAIVGTVLIFTGLVGLCPLYGLLGLSTNPKRRA